MAESGICLSHCARRMCVLDVLPSIEVWRSDLFGVKARVTILCRYYTTTQPAGLEKMMSVGS